VNSNNKKRVTRGITSPSRFSPITVAPNIILPPQQHPNENNTMNNMLRELQNEIQNLKIHHPLKAPLIQQQGIEVEKILRNRGNQTIDNKARDKNQETQATPLTTEINTQVSPSTTEINPQTNNPVSSIETQTNNPVSSIETQTERQQVKRALDQIEYQNTPPIVTFPDSAGPSSPKTPRTPFFNPTTPNTLSRINSFGSTQIPLYGNGQSQLTSQNIPSTSALAIVNPLFDNNPNFGYGNPLLELYKNDKRISKEMRLEKTREVLPSLLNNYPPNSYSPIILDRKIIEEVRRIEKGKRVKYLTNE
jgi:hypothetical protein